MPLEREDVAEALGSDIRTSEELLLHDAEGLRRRVKDLERHGQETRAALKKALGIPDSLKIGSRELIRLVAPADHRDYVAQLLLLKAYGEITAEELVDFLMQGRPS